MKIFWLFKLKKSLIEDIWKPNSAAVTLTFLMRKGLVTPIDRIYNLNDTLIFLIFYFLYSKNAHFLFSSKSSSELFRNIGQFALVWFMRIQELISKEYLISIF